MNNKHIQELTFRLSHALDQNYDVVNLDAVLSVISALEGATITKEQLEATRLAKYINQLRRRTKSEQLARRAKSLLKKWREMVGIQQQTNESLSNQNVLAATNSQHQQLYHRSQPTSPMVSSSVVDQVGGNDADKLSSGDFFRSTASNPAMTSSSTVQSANNKKLAAGSGSNLLNVPIPTVPANGGSHSLVQLSRTDIACQKQPTSFANLLTGINSGTGGQIGGSNMTDILSSPSFRKSNKRKERNSSQTMGTGSIAAKAFGLDQSSSSNADLSRSALRNQVPISNMVPIVIDIQDSNSDSDIIGPTPTPTTPTTAQLTGSGPGSASKLKKSKKDKKRKERETTQQQGSSLLLSSINANITNVIDESYSNLQKPSVDQEYEKFVPIEDDRSRVIYPISGISEILSLSNSSMSSMFPNNTAVASTATDFVTTSDKLKKEASVGSNSNAQSKPLSTSDLTFAGKFKQHSSDGSSELFVFNGNRTDASTVEVVVNDSSSSNIRTSSAPYTFVPFSGSGCNSNDSTSNSRTSQFDIIDVVNQDNSQSKIIDELRQQHKKHNIISTQQTQSQQKPPMALNVSDQLLLPPTSTVNLRQLNNVSESNLATTDPKIPKKRGRKKGSKGVDSVIAKETSLCTQMLMTTLSCKKVKTTKELYTEMQNRKLGISSTTSSPIMSTWLTHQQLSHISRPNSSCSEPSLHSPRTSDACSTNATVSTVATRSSLDKTTRYKCVHGEIDVTDSETNTSGPSRDSATANSHLRRRPSTDSTSNSQLPTKVTPTPSRPPANAVTVESLKQQLRELLSQLPPVPTMEIIEWESIKDVIPCTCKVLECEPTVDAKTEDPETKTADTESSSGLANLNESEVDLSKQELQNSLKIVKSKTMQYNQKDGSELDVKPVQPVPPPPPKPIKSIFDLDFDDDEDPLHQIRAEAAATPAMKIESSIEEIKTENMLKLDCGTENDLEKLQSSVLPVEMNIEQSIVMSDQALVQLPPPMIFPTYSVEEDPKCVAKERFELQTQKVTKFHVTALHNCYIPNVNGNWDNAETTPAHAASITSKVTAVADTKVKNETCKAKLPNKAPSTADLWKNVVPQYGSLITEYIPKDLSHVQFTPNFIPKKSTRRERSHYYLPFLGVARKYLKSKEFSRRRKLKKIKEHKSCDQLAHCEEEAHVENVHPEDHVFGEITQNFSTETNNNNDHVYVKCDINSECVNISLITTPVAAEEQTCALEELSYKSILNDNPPSTLPTDTNRNQMLFSDIEGRTTNIVYSGITIDIAEELSVEPAENVPVINYDLITRNLLTIAKLPANGNAEQVPQQNLYENAANYQSYENQNDQNVNNNSVPATSTGISTVVFTEEKSVSLLTSCSTSEKHVDSRRSSSCSNSSLKQTQNSINMKLRRRRLEQQKQEESKLPASSKKSIGKRSRRKDVNKKEKKPRVIKTIKLAINGNVTKELPIPMGSSSTSTDDDEDEYKDYCENSAGIKCPQFDDGVMGEYNDVNKNRYTIDQFIEEDNYEEGDGVGGEEYKEDHEDEYDGADCDDYDDDYGYVGDYHEVVTRNISATSTGNNHIVLTIKKTPSKTNSPSDSLSAMSPIITAAQAIVPKSVEIVDEFPETLIDIEDGSLKLTNDVVNSCDNDIVEVVVQTEDNSIETLHIQDTAEQSKLDSHVNQVFEDTNTASTHIEIAASPTFLIAAKCRRKRRIKKLSKCCSDDSSSLNRKLHNKLFFSHELQTIAFGVKSKILNISSCSSSCAEDSEYEYATTDDDAREKKVQNSPQPLQNIISYLEDQQNNTKAIKTCPSDFETANSASSHASEDEECDSAVCVRKNRRASEKEHKKEVAIKQSKRQKKKRHRLGKPKGNNVSAIDENSGVAKTEEKELTTVPKPPDEDELALDNNGLLHSFNNIYPTPEQVEQTQRMARRMNSDDDVEFIENVAANDDMRGVVYIDDIEEKKQQQHPNENCDVYSNFYNYNNNSKLDNSYHSLNNRINSSNNSGSHNENETEAPTASRGLNIHGDDVNTINNDTQTITNTNAVNEETTSSTQKLLVPHKEYRTGLRAVDEDVDDEDGNNCARIQQFKEWHQVLQLRSYNDELLTVMPYVVLE